MAATATLQWTFGGFTPGARGGGGGGGGRGELSLGLGPLFDLTQPEMLNCWDVLSKSISGVGKTLPGSPGSC